MNIHWNLCIVSVLNEYSGNRFVPSSNKKMKTQQQQQQQVKNPAAENDSQNPAIIGNICANKRKPRNVSVLSTNIHKSSETLVYY